VQQKESSEFLVNVIAELAEFVFEISDIVSKGISDKTG
jgi:hypothetical protein